MKLPISFVLSLILFSSCNNNYNHKDVPQISETDNISYYITQSRNDTISIEDRTRYIVEGIEKLESYSFNDSLSNSLKIKFSYSAYKTNNYPLFNRITNEIIEQSKQINDTLVLAKSYKYKGYYFMDNGLGIKAYSSFNTSKKLSLSINDTISYAKNLAFLSCIQKDLHQYNSAENDMFEAIKIFSDNNMDSWLESSYNDLGIIYSEKKERENAIKYFLKSRSLIAIDDTISFATSDNNIGDEFISINNYKKGISYLEKVIKVKDLIVDNPQLYGRAKDNLTYAKFRNDLITKGVEKEFIDNYYFKQSIKDTAGTIANRLLLSEYYKYQKRDDKAIETASTALSLSTLSGNNTLILDSYLMLMDVDSINNKKYSQNYIALKDSIDLIDNKVRNKLARIRMETDEYINKAEVLENINYWLLISVSISLFLILITYLYSKQRIKLNNLLKEQEYKSEVRNLLDNEKINIQEAKKVVNSNISKELHDNILSKLFGVRYNLELKDKEEDLVFVDTLRVIEKEIREISHDLKCNLESNLTRSVEKLLSNTLHSSNITYALIDDIKEWDLITNDVQINLYRTIQEALTNIVKHSRARNVRVTFNISSNTFTATVEDNGIGFDVNTSNKGIGLLNIKERADEVGGKVEINSEINKGTKLTLKIYLNANS